MGFDERAQNWDRSSRRRALADAVAEAILRHVALTPSMHLLDAGAGTGLLTRRLLPYVGAVTGVDTSAAMLEKFAAIGGDTEAVCRDILTFRSAEPFDGIVSSMTIHHIEKIPLLFERLYALLKPGAFVAIADLMPEDGTFHDRGNDGVYHFGFDETTLARASRNAGFDDPFYTRVHTVKKESGREYGIFLFTARKGARKR